MLVHASTGFQFWVPVVEPQLFGSASLLRLGASFAPALKRNRRGNYHFGGPQYQDTPMWKLGIGAVTWQRFDLGFPANASPPS